MYHQTRDEHPSHPPLPSVITCHGLKGNLKQEVPPSRDRQSLIFYTKRLERRLLRSRKNRGKPLFSFLFSRFQPPGETSVAQRLDGHQKYWRRVPSLFYLWSCDSKNKRWSYFAFVPPLSSCYSAPATIINWGKQKNRESKGLIFSLEDHEIGTQRTRKYWEDHRKKRTLESLHELVRELLGSHPQATHVWILYTVSIPKALKTMDQTTSHDQDWPVG